MFSKIFFQLSPSCCWWLIWPIQNYAKKKNDWNPGKWVLIWEHSVRATQWIPTWQGLYWFQKSLHACVRVKVYTPEQRYQLGRLHGDMIYIRSALFLYLLDLSPTTRGPKIHPSTREGSAVACVWINCEISKGSQWTQGFIIVFWKTSVDELCRWEGGQWSCWFTGGGTHLTSLFNSQQLIMPRNHS